MIYFLKGEHLRGLRLAPQGSEKLIEVHRNISPQGQQLGLSEMPALPEPHGRHMLVFLDFGVRGRWRKYDIGWRWKFQTLFENIHVSEGCPSIKCPLKACKRRVSHNLLPSLQACEASPEVLA